jgi:hypothetical protein
MSTPLHPCKLADVPLFFLCGMEQRRGLLDSRFSPTNPQTTQ